MQAIGPRRLLAAALCDLGGLILVVSVFLPYFNSEDSGNISLWNAYSHVDWVFLLLGVAAMLFGVSALVTGERAALVAAWSIGLLAAGLALFFPIEGAFHWGSFRVGFYLVVIGPILVVVGSGLGLAGSRPDGELG